MASNLNSQLGFSPTRTRTTTFSDRRRSLNNIFERTENGHSYKGSLKRFGDQKKSLF